MATAPFYPVGWNEINDPYLVSNLAWHLAQAGDQDNLRDLLTDITWMQRRLSTSGLPDLLVAYTHSFDPDVKAIYAALRLSAPP